MNDDPINYNNNFIPPPMPGNNLPPPPPRQRRKPRRQPPQAAIAGFWDRFNSRYPGKVFTVLPSTKLADKKAATLPRGTVKGQRAARSYEEASAECKRDVERIVRECRRTNQKYRDPHFDIEWDLKSKRRDCLEGLASVSPGMNPKGVKRVTDIFESPQFFINGPTDGDVRQGRDGDCYFMAALCGLGNMKKESLIDKVCIKHDQQVGVYGFVFFRDGEWQQTIIDDKLYLRAPDYDEAQEERRVWDDINRKDSEEEYRKAHQTGSRALYFAQCSDENETWLPLLEKAYAKAHGDYLSIDGGFTGEAIEDLTGGVTCEIYSTDILDKEAFWTNDLMKVGQDFLFGCATGFYGDWLDTTGSTAPRERQGIAEGHAYSIMDAVEIKGRRLLKLRNPWGKKEWDGRWSDGSSEWTSEWMDLLHHKFGNDGVFWISYEDLLKKYQHFDRTRIFGPEWSVTQTWTAVHVPWSAGYSPTKFRVVIEEKSPVVIVLAQLDDTYFKGLQGAYGFDLQFRLEDEKGAAGDYIVRSNGNYAMARSVSTDLELEAGTYRVLMKVTATRNSNDEIEDVLPIYAALKREKLIQIGLSYDLAHAKGVLIETRAERKSREAKEKAQKARDRERLKAELKRQAQKAWKKRKALYARDKKAREKKDRADAKRMEMGRAARGSVQDTNMDSLYVAAGGGSLRDDDEVRPTGFGLPTRNGTLESDRSKELMNGHLRQAGNQAAVVEEAEPMRLKSFSGEIVEIGANASEPDQSSAHQAAGPDDEQESIRAAVEDTAGSVAPLSPRPLQPTATTNVVQSLDDAIAEADAATTLHPDENEHVQQHSTEEEKEKEVEVERPPTPIIQINGVDAVTDVRPLPIKPPLSMSEETLSGPSSPPAAPEHVPITEQPSFASFGDPTHSISISNPGAAATATAAAEIPTPAPAPPTAPTASRNPTFETTSALTDAAAISDTDSFPDFDWQSDLDMSSVASSSSSSSSDSDFDSDSSSSSSSHRHRHRHRRRPSRRPTDPNADDLARDSQPPGEEEFDLDPWNAVCVVGLRVYSLLKGSGVRVEVVRSESDLELDDGGDEKVEGGKKGKKGNGKKSATRKKGGDEEEVLDRDDMNKGAVVAEGGGGGSGVEVEAGMEAVSNERSSIATTTTTAAAAAGGKGGRANTTVDDDKEATIAAAASAADGVSINGEGPTGEEEEEENEEEVQEETRSKNKARRAKEKEEVKRQTDHYVESLERQLEIFGVGLRGEME